jgi:hypothetical protein
MRVHRLVGWWQVAAVVAVAPSAWAQSTASFPSDAPAGAPPARTSAPPLPPASPAPVGPRAPLPATQPVAPSPTPTQAPTWSPTGAAGAVSTDTRPPVLPYYQDMPVPPGYEVVSHPASGLITAGVIGMSISYGTAVIVAATQGFDNATGWLVVPVVGPFVTVAARDYEQCKTATVAQARQCVSGAVGEVQYITFAAVDGIFQMASALVILAGAVSSKDELIRQDLVHVKVAPGKTGGVDWSLTVQGNL